MAVYPYCWAWCCLRGDFTMFDRAVSGECPSPEACYFDERSGRWVLFVELPADERARILDPSLWDQIEALRRSDAPTRRDVGLGPSSLDPEMLAALSHQGGGHGWGRPRRRSGAAIGASRAT